MLQKVVRKMVLVKYIGVIMCACATSSGVLPLLLC